MSRFARLWSSILCVLLICFVGTARADIAPPLDNEPTIVHTYLYLEDINDIKLGTGTYDITANLVMRWIDPRLAFSSADNSTRPHVWMGKRADNFVDSIWHPILDVSGERGITSNTVQSVAVYPDGTVVLRQKFTSSPRFTGELLNFPFGHLNLELDITSVAVDVDEMQFRLAHLSPSHSMQALDDVIHGNWTPSDIHWSTSTVSRPDHPDQQFPQIDLRIMVEHDFIDGVHKILLPLSVIALVSWALLWLNFIHLPPYSSPRIAGTITLMLTTIALKFVLDRELPVVHYLTLSDLLFNATIIMLSFSLITSCCTASLVSRDKRAQAEAFNAVLQYAYPAVYLVVVLIGYVWILGKG